MDAKIDPIDIADEFSSSIDYMHTLLSAAEDKVTFYLKNRKLLGQQGELLYGCARELENLLTLMESFLDKMEQDADTVTDLLCTAELSGGASA